MSDRYKIGGPAEVAEMLNQLDSKTRARILSEIELDSPGLAEKIQKLMFVFDDLASVDDRSMQELLKAVPHERFALSLRNASEELLKLIYKNMSKTAGKLLKEELAEMPPQKLTDVEQAQAEIKKIAKQLESQGKLLIKKNETDDR